MKLKAMHTKGKTHKNTTTVIASTATPDRYNDVVEQGDAWDIKSYMRNPVVQFGNRYDQVPVGKTTKLTTDKDGNLVASIEWDTSDTNPLGKQVAASFAGGFMSAVSVGFQPQTSIERSKLPKDHPAHGDRGMYFAGPNTLLEISAVPVPANGEALALRSIGGEVRHVMNVEETDDAYIVTYAKMPDEAAPAEDEDEIEEEAFGDEDEDEESEGYGKDEDEEEAFGDEDEDEDKEHEPGHDEDEEGEGDADEDEDEDDEEDETASKAMWHLVRDVVLELMGHDPQVRRALRGKPTRRKKTRSDGVSDLFGIDI